VSVGYPQGKADIDGRAGGLALDLRNKFAEIRDFKVFLDATVDGDLTALGYTATDISRLRSAFNDLDHLAQVYLGLANQSAAYDFRTFAKFLTGVG
jgi:hypothetical protein